MTNKTASRSSHPAGPNILHEPMLPVDGLLPRLRGQTGVEDAHVRSDGSPATHATRDPL